MSGVAYVLVLVPSRTQGDSRVGGVHVARGAVAREEQDHADRRHLHASQTQEAGRPEQSASLYSMELCVIPLLPASWYSTKTYPKHETANPNARNRSGRPFRFWHTGLPKHEKSAHPMKRISSFFFVTHTPVPVAPVVQWVSSNLLTPRLWVQTSLK